MGRTKALIEIDGVAMATRVAAALKAVGCESVIAYGGDPDELAVLGVPVLPDSYPAMGPLGGLVGVLELFGGHPIYANALVVVVACDLPWLTAHDLRPLLEAARSNPTADVIVARTDYIEPACAIWRVAACEPVRAMYDEGERALHEAINRLLSVEVDVDLRALRNINTPGDLDRYP